MIAVVGEALMDLVSRAGGEPEARCGGANFNLARTIGLLGGRVAMVARISTDEHGRRLRRELAAAGVAPDGLVATDDPTTLAIAVVDAQGVPTYRFVTQGTSAPGLRPEEAAGAVPAGAAVLHVGALGLALHPLALASEHLVATAGPGVLVSVDPNVRPGVADDRDYRERLERILARADLVKVSAEDLALLEPGVEPRQAAAAILARGPRAVLLTRGGDGATVLTGSGARDVAAPKVEVIDTIGAGDAFGGAFLAWWAARGFDAARLGDLDAVASATGFACAVASAVVADPYDAAACITRLRPLLDTP